MSDSDAVPELSVEDEHDGRLRALASLENLRKQKMREVVEARSQGEAYVANAFLEVLDDFERALSSMETITGRGTKKKVLEGLQLIFDKFGQVLGQLEIQGFESEGREFQAKLMDAIAVTPSKMLPPGTVTDQVRRGYLRRGELLRPAQVVVTKEEDDG